MRRSEWGSQIPATLVREFIHAALRQSAVADFVGEYIFDIVTSGDGPPADIGEALRLAIDEVLNVAAPEDWAQVASDLLADARECVEDEEAAAASPLSAPVPDGWWPTVPQATTGGMRRRRKSPVHVEQSEILAWLTEQGSATTGEIARHFNISEHTAWMKADGLVAQGKLEVVPGVRGSYGRPRRYGIPATPGRQPMDNKEATRCPQRASRRRAASAGG